MVVLTGDRIISSHCQSVSERNTNDVVWDGRSGGDTLIVACSQVGAEKAARRPKPWTLTTCWPSRSATRRRPL